MATLKIENFPDQLYERLQALAEGERRSVDQMVVYLLEQAMAVREPLSILELRGLGKEYWKEVDPAAYVEAERESWDSSKILATGSSPSIQRTEAGAPVGAAFL